MTELKIKLATIDDVKNFVSIAARFGCEIDVVSGRYVVDAKSIMGLFSLDLSSPLLLRIVSSDESLTDDIKESFEQFVVA